MSSFKVCLDIVYFAKNWKNCNKIIFKRVNSAVESIFNKSFTEKKGLWVSWTVHETYWKSIIPCETLFSKKKKKNAKTQTLAFIDCIQMGT